MSEKRGVPLSLCAVVLLLFAPYLLFGKVFVPGDFQSFIYPWRTEGAPPVHNLDQFDTAALFYPQAVFINEQLKSGVIPTWDPNIFCGYPLLASGYSALLYPPKLVAHWLLAPTTAVMLLLLVHTVGMGLAMYGWLRGRELSPKAAGLGGLCWMLSGCSATWFELDLALMAVHLPLMLWAFDRRRWDWLAVVGALCLSSSHLQMGFYCGWVVLFYAILRIGLERKWRLAGPFALSGVGVILLSAPTILPFLELLKHCQRPSFSWAALEKFSTTIPGFLTTMLNPDFLGNPSRGFMLNRNASNYSFCEFADYIGLIPLALAVLAVVKARSCQWKGVEIYSWAGLAVLSLLFAATTPFYRVLLFFVPVLSRAIPGRFIIVTVFAGCVLAAHGYEIWIQDQRCRRWVARGVALVSAATALFLIALGGWLKGRPEMAKAWLASNLDPKSVKVPPAMPGPEGMEQWVAGITSNYLLNPQMAMTILAGLLLLAMVKRPRPLVLGLFIAADLLIFMSHYNTVVDPESIFPPAPSVAYLQKQDGYFRVDKQGAAFYNTLVPYGLELVTGYGSVLPKRFVETVGRSQSHLSVTMRSVDLTEFGSPILSALNLKFLMQAPLGLPIPEGWETVYDAEVRILRDPKVLPRVFVRGQVKPFRTFEETLAYMSSPAFDPWSEAVLEQLLPGPLGREADQARPEIRLYESLRVVVSVELPAPGVLVLADSYYPGWVCRDGNGLERPIFPVNGAVRGVYLEAGRHDLDFRFEPQSLALGLRLFAVGLALLGLSLAFRKGRQS